MNTVRLVALTLVVALGTSALAAAQEPGKTGLTMGFPESIGLLWHASDRFALKPEFTFSGSSTDTISSSNGWNLGFSITALIYVHKYDQLRTYIAPRFDYGYTHSSVTIPSQNTTTTSSRHGTGGTGAFGAEYTVSRHFGVFGEAGLTYAHSTIPTIASLAGGSGHSWTTRTAAGVIFYP